MQQVSWISKRLDGFVIEDLIGEGAFSWVFRAVGENDGVARAVKIAKPPELTGQFGQGDAVPTEALAFITGGTTTVKPDSTQLLGLQSAKIRESSDSSLVHIEETFFDVANSYYRMELLEGQTLRELITSGTISVSLMVELAEALQRLSKDPKFKHHGDVKPENIVVTKSGIKLIDPGHFGPLDCAEGNLNRCVVTTPAYYPLLTPDDLFAMGIILWEIACRSHPMDGVAYSGAIDKSNLGQGLVDWVRGRELVGQYYLSPILGVRRPSDLRSDMPGALENVLLKALRLRINPDNKFDKDAGFASLADLASALRNVIAEGVRQL